MQHFGDSSRQGEFKRYGNCAGLHISERSIDVSSFPTFSVTLR